MLHNGSQGGPGISQHDAEEAAAADNGNRSARALCKLKLLSFSRCESPRIPAGHGSPGVHLVSRLYVLWPHVSACASLHLFGRLLLPASDLIFLRVERTPVLNAYSDTQIDGRTPGQ